MTSNKGRAYFGLSGYHFNPDDITRLIGLEPTTTNAAGAGAGLDKPVISTWEISTDVVSDDVDVYALTDLITKQIEPVKDKILQVIESHNLSIRTKNALMLASVAGQRVSWLKSVRLLILTTSFQSESNISDLLMPG